MLRLSDIHAVESEKRKIRKAIYTEIYGIFKRKIKHGVEIGNRHVVLTIPAFLYGQPAFDRGKAYSYIKKQFENGGFTVADLQGYTMYVSWERERERERETATTPVDDSPFVSLINLKKAANKYR